MSERAVRWGRHISGAPNDGSFVTPKYAYRRFFGAPSWRYRVGGGLTVHGMTATKGARRRSAADWACARG